MDHLNTYNPWSVHLLNTDGTERTVLINSALAPSWSSDGKKIAVTKYVGSPVSSYEVFATNSDGGSQTNLTNNPAWDGQPSWQPLPFAYDFSGFFSPVENPPTLNLVKARRVVPVKFSLNGNQGLDIFAEGYPKLLEIDCGSKTHTDGTEQTAGKGNLSYDAAADQYTYLWKTKKTRAGTCQQFAIKLDDGTVHQAFFKFK